MTAIIYIALFIVISGLIMIGTHVLFEVATVLLPLLAVLMIVIGIIVGFVVAIKNTFSVYKKVYSKKGK